MTEDGKSKRGRPPLPEGEGADVYLQIRIKRPRKAAYVRAASRQKKTLSEWVQEMCDAASGYEEK